MWSLPVEVAADTESTPVNGAVAVAAADIAHRLLEKVPAVAHRQKRRSLLRQAPCIRWSLVPVVRVMLPLLSFPMVRRHPSPAPVSASRQLAVEPQDAPLLLLLLEVQAAAARPALMVRLEPQTKALLVRTGLAVFVEAAVAVLAERLALLRTAELLSRPLSPVRPLGVVEVVAHHPAVLLVLAAVRAAGAVVLVPLVPQTEAEAVAVAATAPPHGMVGLVARELSSSDT